MKKIGLTRKKRETVGIKILTGEDRVKTERVIKRELGEGYEVFEGEKLTTGDLPGIFLGATLFSVGEKRKILIKDLGENKEVLDALAEKLEEFLTTDNDVVLWESKIDKRLTSIKS